MILAGCPHSHDCRLEREVCVLVVEDEPLIRQALEIAVRYTFGCACSRSVADGMEAIELLESGFACDLVVCDLMMPRMDGAIFIRRLAESPQFKHMPVVILSAVTESRLGELLRLPNVKGQFTKPIDPLKVGRELQKILNRQLNLENECPVSPSP